MSLHPVGGHEPFTLTPMSRPASDSDDGFQSDATLELDLSDFEPSSPKSRVVISLSSMIIKRAPCSDTVIPALFDCSKAQVIPCQSWALLVNPKTEAQPTPRHQTTDPLCEARYRCPDSTVDITKKSDPLESWTGNDGTISSTRSDSFEACLANNIIIGSSTSELETGLTNSAVREDEENDESKPLANDSVILILSGGGDSSLESGELQPDSDDHSVKINLALKSSAIIPRINLALKSSESIPRINLALKSSESFPRISQMNLEVPTSVKLAPRRARKGRESAAKEEVLLPANSTSHCKHNNLSLANRGLSASLPSSRNHHYRSTIVKYRYKSTLYPASRYKPIGNTVSSRRYLPSLRTRGGRWPYRPLTRPVRQQPRFFNGTRSYLQVIVRKLTFLPTPWAPSPPFRIYTYLSISSATPALVLFYVFLELYNAGMDPECPSWGRGAPATPSLTFLLFFFVAPLSLVYLLAELVFIEVYRGI